MIGVVTQNDNFLAYVCSADDAFNGTHARWFRGKIGKNGAITAEANGAKLNVTIDVAEATGTLLGSDKASYKFTASATSDDGVGGVFRAETIIDKELYIAGWVKNDSGDTVDAVVNKKKNTVTKLTAPANPKGAPASTVGQGKKASAVAGARLDDLEFPLPGQLVGATLTNIDAKKNTFTVKTDDGKSLTLPGNNVFSKTPGGKRGQENLGSPTPFLKIGAHFHLSIKCNKRDPKTGKCDDRQIDIGFDVN